MNRGRRKVKDLRGRGKMWYKMGYCLKRKIKGRYLKITMAWNKLSW